MPNEGRLQTCKAWTAGENPAQHRIVDARTSRYAGNYARWQLAPEGIGGALRARARAPNFPSFRGASESFKWSSTLTDREARHPSGLILLTMSLGVLIAQIDTCVVNLAVKPIGTDLKASVTELQWIVDVYNFVYASLLLTAGTLVHLYGRRLILALANAQ